MIKVTLRCKNNKRRKLIFCFSLPFSYSTYITFSFLHNEHIPKTEKSKSNHTSNIKNTFQRQRTIESKDSYAQRTMRSKGNHTQRTMRSKGNHTQRTMRSKGNHTQRTMRITPKEQ